MIRPAAASLWSPGGGEVTIPRQWHRLPIEIADAIDLSVRGSTEHTWDHGYTNSLQVLELPPDFIKSLYPEEALSSLDMPEGSHFAVDSTSMIMVRIVSKAWLESASIEFFPLRYRSEREAPSPPRR
jgi:hypothetical protein